MSRVNVFLIMRVSVDREEYESITGVEYESDAEAREALGQSVRWSLERNVGGWCGLGNDAAVIV